MGDVTLTGGSAPICLPEDHWTEDATPVPAPVDAPAPGQSPSTEPAWPGPTAPALAFVAAGGGEAVEGTAVSVASRALSAARGGVAVAGEAAVVGGAAEGASMGGSLLRLARGLSLPGLLLGLVTLKGDTPEHEVAPLPAPGDETQPTPLIPLPPTRDGGVAAPDIDAGVPEPDGGVTVWTDLMPPAEDEQPEATTVMPLPAPPGEPGSGLIPLVPHGSERPVASAAGEGHAEGDLASTGPDPDVLMSDAPDDTDPPAKADPTYDPLGVKGGAPTRPKAGEPDDLVRGLSGGVDPKAYREALRHWQKDGFPIPVDEEFKAIQKGSWEKTMESLKDMMDDHKRTGNIDPGKLKNVQDWTELNDALHEYEKGARQAGQDLVDELARRAPPGAPVTDWLKADGLDPDDPAFADFARRTLQGGDDAIEELLYQIDPDRVYTAARTGPPPLAAPMSRMSTYDPLGVKARPVGQSFDDLVHKHGFVPREAPTVDDFKKALADHGRSGFPIDAGSDKFFDLQADVTKEIEDLLAQGNQEIASGGHVSQRTLNEMDYWRGMKRLLDDYQFAAGQVRPRLLDELAERTGQDYRTLIDQMGAKGYSFTDPRFVNKADGILRGGDAAIDEFIRRIQP